jgi:membrane protein DedA with SNARE-associated domain
MADPPPMPRPLVRRLVLIAGLILYVAGTIGSNIAPAVIDDHPVTILLLSSRNRNLFASVPFIDPVPYALVGFLRVLAAGVVLYLIGRWYGAKGIGWVEGQVGELPATIRWIQRGVDRAGWLLVVVMPGSNIVCLMVGHRRMPPRTFVPLIMTGIALKLGVLWAGGKLFEDQIKTFLDFIERYQWWIVIALFVVTFIQSAGRVRKSVPEVIEEIERPVAPSDAARYGAGMDGGPDTK